MNKKYQSPLFPARRVIILILLVGFLLFLVSCSNTQSTYQPQQSPDIGSGCSVSSQRDIENLEIRYGEIKNRM